jgi:tape measure domain-containing protein
MSNTIDFDVRVKLEDFERQLDQMQSRLEGATNRTQASADKMGDSFSKVGKMIGTYFGVQQLAEFGKKVISVRGEMQQLEIAFSTMLGSAEKANALMAQLTETAAKTPFDMNSIANGAKQLLAYGTASEDVNDTLVRLGNIASGLSLPLNDLVYLYGTTQTQGRLFTQDVRQFMGRGIPLVDELSKTLGKTTDEINAMVTAGEIGFEDVRKVIENMTNEGGQFYQLMEKQSASLTGQMSNLGDSIDTMFNEIGKALQEPLSDGISMVNTLVENYKTLGRVIGTLVSIYGGYNVALRIYNGLQKEGAIRNAIASFLKLQRAVKQATTLQAAFNAVCSVNPYVLLATAIVGVVGAIAMFGNQNAIAERKQQAVNDVLDEAAQKAEAAKNAITEYTNALSENAEQWKRISAYENLQGLVKGTAAETNLPSLDDWGRMDAPTKEGWVDYLNTIVEAQKLSEEYKKIKGNGVGSDNEAIAQLNGISERQQELWAEYAKRQEQRGRAVEQATETVVKNKAYYEDLKKKLTSEFENLETNDLTASLKKSYSDRIAQIQKMIDLYDLEADKKKKDAEAQKELNTALKEYQDILDAFAKGEMGTFEAQRFEAYKSYDTTEGKLDEYAKKGVDVSQGRTDNLANLQSTLAKIDEAERKAIADLNDQLTQGTRDAFEQRAKEIEKTYSDLAKDITEQFRNDPALSAMLDEIEQAKNRELFKNDDEWGTSQEDHDLQIKKIDLQKQLNEGKLSQLEYEKQIYEIELAQAKNDVAKAQNALDYADTLENRQALETATANYELKKSEGGKVDDSDAKVKNVSDTVGSSISSLSDQFSKLADILDNLESDFAGVMSGLSSGLSGVSSSFNQVFGTVEKQMSGGKLGAKDYAGNAMAAAQGILGVMENITSQIAENKKVTEAWETACRNSAHEMAMMKIEALEYEDPNIWGGDSYDNKLSALVKERTEITKQAKEAGKLLEEEGQVQTGTKTVLGWKNAAKDALLGAAAGAAIGSMATPIGTAIGAAAGAVGGFLTGLFAGKQKIAVYDSLKNVYGEIYDEETMEINEEILADYDKLDDATKQMVDNLQEILDKQKEVQEQWEETIKDMTDDVYDNLKTALEDAFTNKDVFSAMDDIKDYLKKQFESVISDKVFDAVYGDMIDSLSAKLTDMDNPISSSFSIMEEVAGLVASMPERMTAYEQAMESLEDAAKRYNLGDMFSEETQNALSGSISSMSEDTASKINANFMGLKLTAMEINSQMDKVATLTSSTNTILNHSLTVQQEIAQNTSYCRNLEAIQSDIRAMKRDGVRLVK